MGGSQAECEEKWMKRIVFEQVTVGRCVEANYTSQCPAYKVHGKQWQAGLGNELVQIVRQLARDLHI